MKNKIGQWFIWLLLIADQFLFWGIYYWNASTISNEQFWPVFAFFLCNRIIIGWTGIFIASVYDIETTKILRRVLRVYILLMILHTAWFGLTAI